MNTYLFAWNPTKWDWTTLQQDISEITQTGKAILKWTCVSHKIIKPGDRAFLVRVGVFPKGIIGSGVITTYPFISEHCSGENKMVHRVKIEFDVILAAEEEPILTLDLLQQGKLSMQNWTPQSSGISISPDRAEELEAIWFDFLTTQRIRVNPFNALDAEYHYFEGTPSLHTMTTYERNPFARKKCIEHYGLSCAVCKFDFEETYGVLGRDFIHVHHVRQIADIAKEYRVDPIEDLRPLCPNCHAMIHRKREALSIEDLKLLIND